MLKAKIVKNVRMGSLLLAVLWSLAAVIPASASEKIVPAGSYKVVGIGPGDADLLTTRALESIREADLIFCGSETREKLAGLVDFKGKELLDGYGVLFRYYGKDCAEAKKEQDFSRQRMSCEEYHQKQAEFAKLVRDAVSKGKRVVMLSGGDPTIYGPDMWSLQELRDLNPTVIPGLSAFNAANAALQVGLGEVVITAPFKKENGKDTIEALAGHERATMVVFMPRDMKELFSRLSSAYSPDTPVGIVSDAGVAGQEKVVSGAVGSFAADSSGLDSQRSIVYVGKALADARFKKDQASPKGKGKFYLVGTGPGDSDLATLKALKVIGEADLIFAHQKIQERFSRYLSGKNVIDGYHRLFPFYGKKCSEVSEEDKARERMSCEEYHKKQEEFSALARAAMAEGKTVAMLDNGDPLVYGPCSWTLAALQDLNTEVVPGLSSFNAANAALRAGVTEGESSHSVILASGWSVEEMAVHQGTMVLFTMRTEFQKFIDGLSKHYPADTPVAIVQSAGYADKEKVVHGKLGSIAKEVGGDKLPFEYLLYVGDFLKNSVDLLNN